MWLNVVHFSPKNSSVQKIPINYPKQKQSSTLIAAFITHLHYHKSSLDLVKLKNSFFVHNFYMHPEGSFCGEAAGSEMSYGCCWALQSSWDLLPVRALLICCPCLLSEVTSQTPVHFSKLWTHLWGQCQTGRHFAGIQKPSEPSVSSTRLDQTHGSDPDTEVREERGAWVHHQKPQGNWPWWLRFCGVHSSSACRTSPGCAGPETKMLGTGIMALSVCMQ